jgi:DNA-binding NarL/FixJ family response regulator
MISAVCQTNSELKTLKVLIVDDNETFRTDLKEFLDHQDGVDIIAEASNGQDAIYFTHSLHPDLVLLDISLPGMSGIEVAREIKEFFHDTRIVFVTIHEEKTYQAIAETLGADGFVCKSSMKKDLPRVLQRIKDLFSEIS